MQHYIKFGDVSISYTLVRSKRKTIGISISPKNGLRVLAPSRVSLAQIEDVLISKASWISKNVAEVEKIKSQLPVSSIKEREFIVLLGHQYKLKIDKHNISGKVSLSLNDGKLTIDLPHDTEEHMQDTVLRDALKKWYKEKAYQLVHERMALYSQRMGALPAKLIIKEHKSRWGSCTSKNVININWRIVIAPVEIVDYLVVHELAHIKVKNHSKQFWEVVEAILPDYKSCSKWLKKNGAALEI